MKRPVACGILLALVLLSALVGVNKPDLLACVLLLGIQVVLIASVCFKRR